MSRIHYFNPGHETAVLLGTQNYTAPTNVRKMQKDLALLPVWYAEEDDFVYLEDSKATPPFFAHLPKDLHPAPIPVTKAMLMKNAPYLSPMDAAPWGLSPHSLHLFEQLRDKAKVRLSVPTWKEDYFRLTGRQTAAECLEKIQALLPDLPIPVAPRFCTKIREVERYMILCNAPFVLKTPYSSSGRGLLWVEKRKPDTKTKNWIEGVFNKQGMISIESGLDKVQDFAMEFYSDGQGTVRYEGLSVFNTEERGFYTGNILEEQSTMLSRITRFTGEETYSRIQEAVRSVLQEVYGSTYAGCIGVDMLVYRQKDGSFAIHPCIEINMRYTMGMVALRLFQHYVAPRAVGDLPCDYPTLRDVVDEAIVRAKVEWQSVPGEKEAYTGLLKHLFAVLDNEVASSRQFGEFVSLDAPVEPDAQDVAEAMVEEEIFEFYQHDDTLKLADIFAGSQHPDVATIAEQEELIDRSSEFAFAFDLLKDMPRLWRRIFLLIRVDGLNASSVSEILLIPGKEDAVRRWLMQAEAFIAAHLEEAGVSKNGNDWLQGVDWSALSVTRSEAASLWSKEANHEE